MDAQNLNLDYLVPIVAADGNAVMVSEQDVPTLVFFQARQQHDGHLHGDVVAAVRFNNLEELRNLSKSINDTIKKHQSREP